MDTECKFTCSYINSMLIRKEYGYELINYYTQTVFNDGTELLPALMKVLEMTLSRDQILINLLCNNSYTYCNHLDMINKLLLHLHDIFGNRLIELCECILDTHARIKWCGEISSSFIWSCHTLFNLDISECKNTLFGNLNNGMSLATYEEIIKYSTNNENDYDIAVMWSPRHVSGSEQHNEILFKYISKEKVVRALLKYEYNRYSIWHVMRYLYMCFTYEECVMLTEKYKVSLCGVVHVNDSNIQLIYEKYKKDRE